MTLTSTLLFLGCSDNSSDKKIYQTDISDKPYNENLSQKKDTNNNFRVTSDSISTDIEFVKTIGVNGNALDIALSDDGDFAYIASGDYGLQVLDVSNPSYPKLIGTYDAYGYVNHVEVIDNIVFVSYVATTWENYERLNAFDITYPYNVEYLGYYEGYKSNNHKFAQTPNLYYHLTDNAIFLTSKDDGREQNSYPLYDPYAFALSGGYIFVANGREGVTILKTEDSASVARLSDGRTIKR
jgi:hypothetical protein